MNYDRVGNVLQPTDARNETISSTDDALDGRPPSCCGGRSRQRPRRPCGRRHWRHDWAGHALPVRRWATRAEPPTPPTDRRSVRPDRVVGRVGLPSATSARLRRRAPGRDRGRAAGRRDEPLLRRGDTPTSRSRARWCVGSRTWSATRTDPAPERW